MNGRILFLILAGGGAWAASPARADEAALPGAGLNVRLKDEKRTDLVVARDRVREFKEKMSF